MYFRWLFTTPENSGENSGIGPVDWETLENSEKCVKIC